MAGGCLPPALSLPAGLSPLSHSIGLTPATSSSGSIPLADSFSWWRMCVSDLRWCRTPPPAACRRSARRPRSCGCGARWHPAEWSCPHLFRPPDINPLSRHTPARHTCQTREKVMSVTCCLVAPCLLVEPPQDSPEGPMIAVSSPLCVLPAVESTAMQHTSQSQVVLWESFSQGHAQPPFEY